MPQARATAPDYSEARAARGTRSTTSMRTLASWGLCLLLPALAAEADIGRVKSASGAASIERAGSLLPATPGQLLEQSDVLVTGPDGSLSVTYVDNTRFAAGANARVELARFRFDPTTHEGEFDTRVRRGSLAIISGQIAKHTPDAMRVHTPTSILGVRGTEFIVDVGP